MCQRSCSRGRNMMLLSTSGAAGAYLLRCLRESHFSLEKTMRSYRPPPFFFGPPLLRMWWMTDVNQFSLIIELLGTPPDDIIETICCENVGYLCIGIFAKE